jgi:hypothetical protein
MAKYCRINLAKTNYHLSKYFVEIEGRPVEHLKRIFKAYCTHKNFDGVMPIFDSQYTDPANNILGYCNDVGELVAFSLLREYDNENVESLQFAWDYKEPKLRLGIKSIETECSVYKHLGFKYLYLGFSEEYKTKFDGYEEIGIQDV